jgi:transposase
MPGKAAKITLTERQQEILQTLRNAATAPAHLRQRATLILLAFEGRRNDEIAQEIGLGPGPVGTWRRRGARAFDRLIEIECTAPRAALRRAIEAVLSDAPRPGAPGKFTPEQVTQILAVACEPPANSGRPITHWTTHELADEVVQRGIVASISPSQVGRYLREAALQPHKSRYWLTDTKAGDNERVEALVEQAEANLPEGRIETLAMTRRPTTRRFIKL